MGLNFASKYPTKTNGANPPAYPWGSARDVTVSGDRTGTPWTADVLNDFWGFASAVYVSGDITPDNDPEQANDSEIFLGLQRSCGHPGEVVAWTGPTSYLTSGKIRLLPLTGQVVTIADYSQLCAAVYVGDGNNPTAPAYYKTSDAGGTTRSTSGSYMVFPDLRGYVLRGLDTAAAVDPDGAGRAVGDVQQWAMRKHNHWVWKEASDYLDGNNMKGGTGCAGATTQAVLWVNGAQSNSEIVADGIPTSQVYGYINYWIPSSKQSADELRMINSAVHWCIRY